MALLPVNIAVGDPGHADKHNAVNAEVNAVNTALALKADATATTTALALKADASTVNTALGTKPTFVMHGGTAGTARPTIDFVIWVGTVHPTNSLATDAWIDTGSTSGALLAQSIITASTFTPTSSSNEVLYRGSSASAQTVTLPNNLVAGSNFSWRQVGAGQTTFAAGSGATLVNYEGAQYKTAGQWATVSLDVDTNSNGTSAAWIIAGQTAA